MKKSVQKYSSTSKFDSIPKQVFNLQPVILYLQDLKALTILCTKNQNENPETKVLETIQNLLGTFENYSKLGISYPIILISNLLPNEFSDSTLAKIKNMFQRIISVNEPESKNGLLNQNIFQNCSKPECELINAIQSSIPIQRIKKTIKLGEINGETKEEILGKLKSLQKKSLTSVSIPDVKWSDIGGLENAKDEIMNTIMLPQKYPEVFTGIVKPRKGLLFYGPPGTGKTLLAKAIANECKMNFISIKGPELLNMYVGESEKNVRDIFFKAKNNSPCIIFFDELDSLAPKRGQSSDSNQVMDRIVSQLLTEIDEVGNDVFIIGATNRPDLLDESLMRPGRFDKLLYLGINTDKESTIKILKAQSHKFPQNNIDFEKIANLLPENITGADLHSLSIRVVLNAAKRKMKEIDEEYEKRNSEFFSFEQFLEEYEKSAESISLSQIDYELAIPMISPSVKPEDLKRYEALRKKFSK